MRAYAGCDNGVTGAIAIIWPTGEVALHKTPVVEQGGRKYIDALKVKEIFEFTLLNSKPFLLLEQTQLNPKFGAKGNHSQGRSEGAYDAILKILGFPHQMVQPKEWQKEMHAGVRRAGMDTGEASIEACRRLFPKVNLVLPGCKKADDGLADALLIAEYARRKNL